MWLLNLRGPNWILHGYWWEHDSAVAGDAGYRVQPTPGSWFGKPAQVNQAFHPSESWNWCQTCLGMIKHLFTLWLATPSHCMDQIHIQTALRHPVKVDLVAHSKTYWSTLFFILYQIYLSALFEIVGLLPVKMRSFKSLRAFSWSFLFSMFQISAIIAFLQTFPSLSV